MSPVRSAFGVDFGTTNTRVVFHNGRRPLAIPVRDQHGRQVYNIPSVIGYSQGRPVAFGYEALTRKDIKLVRSIKWLLARDDLLDIQGEFFEPVQIVADFFRYLRDVVRRASDEIPDLRDNPDDYLERISITVPVSFPYPARQALCRACEIAGIDVGAMYLEPVAALYSNPDMYRLPGTLAAFDWGGGTLDTAAVRYCDGMAEVLSVKGMQWGGDDLDELLLTKILDSFIGDQFDSNLPDEFLNRLRDMWLDDADLLSQAELAKIRLSEAETALVSRARLWGSQSLNHEVTRTDLEEWFSPKIEEALGVLDECLTESGHPARRRLLISGGTCNIPLVQLQLRQQFGTDRIEMPHRIETELSSVNDIGMGTALGAARLTVYGGQPVFAQDIGILLDEGTDEESFYPLYRKGEMVRFGTPHLPSRIVPELFLGQTQVSLKICTRKHSTDGSGKLFDIVPIPVNEQHTSFRVKCVVDPSLVLRIDYLDVPLPHEQRQSHILDIPMAFRIPGDV